MAYIQPVITSDAGTFSPLLRLSANKSTTTRNVLHELIGGGIAVTFGEDNGPASTLEMLFTSEAAYQDAYTQLRAGHVFELTDYSKPSTSMFFVVSGSIDAVFDVESKDTWTVTVEVQEVVP